MSHSTAKYTLKFLVNNYNLQRTRFDGKTYVYDRDKLYKAYEKYAYDFYPKRWQKN